MSKRRVLILCTGNSCRSQMAEGLWRQLAGGRWEAHSAGSRPAGFVHPLAVEAMAEIGVDIRSQESKSVAPHSDQTFDLVVTVCDNAARDCPVFPNTRQTLHWPFDDPAAVDGPEAQQVAAFRRIRDEIAAQITAWLREHDRAASAQVGRD